MQKEQFKEEIICGIPVPTVEAGDSIIASEDLLRALQVLFVKSVASAGIDTVGTKLPHLDMIQSSFGKHDITNVQAHLAPSANDIFGTMAYTMGNHVAFAQNPSLRIAAHEATHVVQQRAGVILQFWSAQHKDFTRRAIERWNIKHPRGIPMHISPILKQKIIDCSDDPDHTGRALTGTVSDALFMYIPFIVGSKEERHKKYAAASSAKKKEMEAAVRSSVCASEGPSHGEGNRPKYGSGGWRVNHVWMMSQIRWADRLSLGQGFLSMAGAGQLGDAMHFAQDRGSHCEGNKHEGHDDVRDKLGMSNGSCGKHGYDTDCPECNKAGARKADQLSDQVLIEYAGLRKGKL